MQMTEAELAAIYRDYIACLNEQDWPRLGHFVARSEEHTSELQSQ